MDMQDDVAARLEASRDREGVLVAEPSGSSVNPAAQSTDEEGEGLATLDAGTVEDTTTVEEKIEAVATAIEQQEDDSSDVSGFTSLSHSPLLITPEDTSELRHQCCLLPLHKPVLAKLACIADACTGCVGP